MNGLRALAAVAAATAFASHAKSQSAEGPLVVAFFSQQQASAVPDVTGPIPRRLAAGVERDAGGRGGIDKQIASVAIGCLKPELMRVIREASGHFHATAVITSGYRPGRRSYHGRCMAADVQIPGVSPGALARWFRSQPGVGGVGVYGHTRSVHVDVAPRQFTWRHGRRKRYAASAHAWA